jgi:hypothetical protein
MPKLRRPLAATTKRPQAGALPEASSRSSGRGQGRGAGSGGAPARGTRAEALDKIFETAERQGEGFRTAALGLPRHGKTFHLQDVIDKSLERGILEWVFVHDTKKPAPQYAGTIRENVADLAARPLEANDSPVVVFHPSLSTIERPTVEEVASLALHTFGRSGQRCALVVDELAKALKGSQSWESKTTGEIIREGSSQNVSIAVTGQDPQSWPREALAMMESYSFFRLMGRNASYVVEAFRLPPQAEEILPRLEVGEFLLYTLEGWDGKIYGPS